jgi:hypothetical protein
MIIEHLDNSKQDILALGLASSQIWLVVLDHIYSPYRSTPALWAGSKVAFMARRTFQIPQPFRGEGLYCTFRIDRFKDVVPMFLKFKNPGINSEKVKVSSTPVKLMDRDWIDALDAIKGTWQGLDEVCWCRVREDLETYYKFPQDRVWVLRNLTTAEYVRSDRLHPVSSFPRLQRLELALASCMTSDRAQRLSTTIRNLKRRVVRMTYISDTTPLDLAQVFLILISSATIPLPCKENALLFQSGVWAGDSFDLVTLDAHAFETEAHHKDGLEWRDVSKEVVDDVANLRGWVYRLRAWEWQRWNKSAEAPWGRKLLKANKDRQKFHHWKAEGFCSIGEQ